MPYSPRLTEIVSANRIKKEGLALYIVFLIMAAVFLLLKTGLFKMKMNINIDLFYLNIPPVKLKVRISPATICLVIAWFTGLNQHIRIPAWSTILIILVVLPSLYETLLGDQ